MVVTLIFGGMMMISRLQKWVFVGLFLCVSAVHGFAAESPLRILIKPTSETVKTFRYQTGFQISDAWIETDISSPVLVLEGFDSSKDALYVQQSKDNIKWSDTYIYRYDTDKNTWNVSLDEKTYEQGLNKTLYIQIKPTSETIRTFRYQTNPQMSEVWTQSDISNPVLALEDFNASKDMLYVQQSKDNIRWSDTYTYRYDANANAWSVFFASAEKTGLIDSLDVKLYGLYPLGKSVTYYSYVLGAGLKLNFSLGNQEKLIAYGEAAYSSGPSATDWVDTMQAIHASVGMGYRISLSDKVKLTPEIGYGVLFHLLDADLDQDGVNTLEVYADQQVRLSVNLSYALGSRYELFLSPLGVLFFENGHIGTMFGCQSGLRFNF